jgi:prepilin-type N-terminal cleavage/methylation domain-containing protein
MKPRQYPKRVGGFSLIEMMVAVAIFLIIGALAFSLLGVAQKRYQSESQVLNSFQEARLGLDQIVRDINASGYPPPNQFEVNPQTPNLLLYASAPFAWPNYLSSPPCAIGTCTTPSDFDLIIETEVPAQNCASNGVSWIRYQLIGTTLYRGVTCKSNGDPDSSTLPDLVPFVQNVMNNTSTAVPIFAYTCDTQSGPQTCTLASAADNSVLNIRAVGVTLIVATPMPDAQTGAPRLVELNGRGQRVNPNE